MFAVRICCFLIGFLSGQILAADLTDVRGLSFKEGKSAQHIISLAPHLTELLFSLGVDKQIVGTIAFSDYPEAALAIPRVGDASRLDIERIISLKPDLVVAWQSGNSAADINKLETLGIPVVVTETRNLPDIAELLLKLGRLTGKQEKARSLATEYLDRLKTLEQRYSGARTVTVFYQIWQRPLMTINGQNIISDAISLCGGRNLFADLDTIAPTVDLEALMLADPEVIIANTVTGDSSELQKFWASWPSLKAVKKNNIYTISSSLIVRPSLRIIEGVDDLCKILEQVRMAQ